MRRLLVALCLLLAVACEASPRRLLMARHRSAAAAAADPFADADAHWPIDADTDPWDDANGTNELYKAAGIYTPTYVPPSGDTSGHADLDSLDYGVISNSPIWAISGDFTIGAWARPTGLVDKRDWIFSAYDASAPGGASGFSFGKNTTGSGVWHLGWFVDGGYGVAVSDGVPVLDQWVWVVFVRESGTGTLYLDNVAQASTGSNAGAIDFTTDMFWGANYGGGSHYWDGQIDDCFLYHRALSSAELTAKYNATSGAHPNP